MKILIADDMMTQRLVLSMTLKKLDIAFEAAEDGAQAWELFQREYFPVVITDWQMPNMDGLELCRNIRARPYEQYTYVMILTTLDGKLNYLEALEAGADDFLVKPFDDQLLLARLVAGQRISNLLTQARLLQGQVAVCPTCRKLRTPGAEWMDVYQYLAAQTQARVEHERCPDCIQSGQGSRQAMIHGLRAPQGAMQ